MDGDGTVHVAEPLSAGVSLRRRYSVRRVLRSYDAVTVYDGFDYRARQPVAILEFLPKQIVTRTADVAAVSPVDRQSGELFFLASEAFLKQYSALTQTIGNPNIISVFEAFFENGTAYAATEPLDGLSLGQYLLWQARTLTEGELVYILRNLSDALLVVHSLNILHHGVAEESIALSADGTVKLTQFAAAGRIVELRRTVDDAQPAEDIRALGETLFRAYTGKDAFAAGDGLEGMPAQLQALFTGMLSDNPAERFATVFDLRYMVESLDIPAERPRVMEAMEKAERRTPSASRGDKPSDAGAAPVRRQTGQTEAPFKTPRIALIAMGAVLLILIGVLIWAVIKW